jgi:NitT/TauT family transport system ATP-binding protein
MTPILRFENVVKSYGRQRVIDGLSLEVRAGEVVGVQGPSGVGKTTLLRLALGIERPDSGRIECVARSIGYVFQEPRLLPWRTALENVALPLLALGWDKKRARKTALALLEKMGMGEAADRYPRQLSGGMAQRVDLARAFAPEPELLLLDEPFSALDAERRVSVRHELETMLRGKQYAVLYVTHHPYEIEGLATRRLIFQGEGRVDLV